MSQLQPMEEVGVDLFYFGNDWIIMVDRYSGYFMIKQLNKTTTRAVIKVLQDWFTAFGWPKAVRSDGGPQFQSEFENWCKEHNIRHELASAYHPESNGLAEAGVKNAKLILEKCKLSGEEYEAAMQDWLLTPRTDTGFSPAFMFFGRTPRGRLPYVHTDKSTQEAETAREQNMSCDPHRPARFVVGDAVLGQHMKTKQWSMRGTVTAVRDNGQSYLINFGGARENLRNARYLRPAPRDQGSDSDLTPGQQVDSNEPSSSGLRRGTRVRKKRVTFQAS